MKVPGEVIQTLADLRQWLQDKCEPPVYVSDRRLVKAVALMQVGLWVRWLCVSPITCLTGPRTWQYISCCHSRHVQPCRLLSVTGTIWSAPTYWSRHILGACCTFVYCLLPDAQGSALQSRQCSGQSLRCSQLDVAMLREACMQHAGNHSPEVFVSIPAGFLCRQGPCFCVSRAPWQHLSSLLNDILRSHMEPVPCCMWRPAQTLDHYILRNRIDTVLAVILQAAALSLHQSRPEPTPVQTCLPCCRWRPTPAGGIR